MNPSSRTFATPFLTAELKIALKESFFEHLDKTLQNIIRAAIAKALTGVNGHGHHLPVAEGTGRRTTDSPASEPKPYQETSIESVRDAIVNGAGLLDTRGAAAFLRISARTLWSLTNQGSIPCIRIGRAVRYDRRDLLEWAREQKAKCGRPRA